MDGDEGSTRVAASICGRGSRLFAMTFALMIHNFQSVSGFGTIGKWCLFVAAPGFLGYVVGNVRFG